MYYLLLDNFFELQMSLILGDEIRANFFWLLSQFSQISNDFSLCTQNSEDALAAERLSFFNSEIGIAVRDSRLKILSFKLVISNNFFFFT